MSPLAGLSARLAHALLDRLQRRSALGVGPDWAQAMRAEAEACADDGERLGWALGCWRARIELTGAVEHLMYAAALGLGVLTMTAHQWVADEGLGTLAWIGAISLMLGLLKPGRVWTTGGVIGLAVTAVLVFEILSGVRPAYEHQVRTLGDCLRWTVFGPPALLAAGLGGWLRRRIETGAVA